MTSSPCAENSAAGRSANDFAQRLAQLNNEALQLALRGLQPWFDAYRNFLGAALPAMGCACKIPETKCPPHCACLMEWTVAPGDQRLGHLRITNPTADRLQYALTATPFQSCRETLKATPQLEPAGGVVPAGGSLLAKVQIATDASFRAGETYESEIKVRGLYERCVCLRVHVSAEEQPCCSVEMGQIPERIRADDWWRHFQCTEACFEPVRPTPNDNRARRRR